MRERLALPGGIAALWPRLDALCVEAALLSTCNRCELYACVEAEPVAEGYISAVWADATPPPRVGEGAGGRGSRSRGSKHAPAHDSFVPLARALAEAAAFPLAELEPYLVTRSGVAAARHLLRVACGLDSMIVGEAQIVGQVREVIEAARAVGAAGLRLDALFRQALTAGKRARTETAIGQSAASVSQAAVELARRVFGDLRGAEVLLIGAGRMAELAAQNLLAYTRARLVVANRTPAHAEALAARFGGAALPLDRLGEALARCDVVIASTGAPRPVVTAELVAAASRARRGRPLFLVDIAVPRDVEPAAGELEHVVLYNIDDLQALVAANVETRRRESARVEAIVEAELARLIKWWGAREIVPTIAALRERAEAIRQAELARAGLHDLTERQRHAVNALTQGIVNKLLHQPVVRLKLQAAAGGADEYAHCLRDLFALDASEPAP